MNKWKVAAYVRLSSEDDNDKSNSIVNQIEIIDKYVENKNDMELIDYYIDNGCNGTDFNRKGFARMMSDIKDKKVNTIIVKDLSRFGRNHIEVEFKNR
jgi:DNA invertase Pin-like site-specific DNA recombinase